MAEPTTPISKSSSNSNLTPSSLNNTSSFSSPTTPSSSLSSISSITAALASPVLPRHSPSTVPPPATLSSSSSSIGSPAPSTSLISSLSSTSTSSTLSSSTIAGLSSPSTAGIASPPPVRRTIICQDATIVGDVKVGDGCILHPKSSIIAERGPIILGDNNIIEELVTIINKTDAVLKIGSNNLFEVGAYIECKQIGDNNLIETKGIIGQSSVIGTGCTVCAGATLPPAFSLSDSTVFYSPSLSYNVPDAPDMHLTLHARHLEILYKTLPNFHHLKPVVTP